MLDIITDHIDIWTSAKTPKANGGRGRGKNGEQTQYGIKKLRELILELAVRGKLVPQNPKDEPASVLLEKIAKEKAQLIKAGKIKKQELLPKIEDNEKPFCLPHGWEFSRLGTLTNSLLSGGTPSKSNPKYWGGNIPWASVKDLGQSKYIETTQDFITEAGLEAGSKLADIGDVLICTRMGLGKIAICKNKIAINQDLKAIKFTSKMNIDYFLIAFSTLNIIGTGTTVSGIKQEKLLNIILPFPPIAEQHRIVAKVDELMALCDQLEQQQTDSDAAHKTLVETLLGSLTNSASAGDFQQTWKLIENNFDTLFTTEHSIDQLKQAILQLAVMGKLVPQDPDSEPASVLLRKIAKEKSSLLKSRRIRKQEASLEISENEKPFPLPKDWQFARLQDIAEITSGVTKGRKLAGRKAISVPYLRVANVQRGYLDLEEVKYIDIPKDELEKYTIKKRDLLITEGGDWDKVGRTAIWNNEIPLVVHQNHVFKARAYLKEQNVLWLEKYLNSSVARKYFEKSSKQTTNLASINKTQLSNCIIAIPPLTEQRQIVAKIDALMSLCDAIKWRINETKIAQTLIADVTVKQTISNTQMII